MRVVVAAVCLTIVGLLAAVPADATAPGKNGEIAFRRFVGPDQIATIFTIRSDGTGERQVAQPPEGASDDFPDYASDGSFIAGNVLPTSPDGRPPTAAACAGSALRATAPTSGSRRTHGASRSPTSPARSWTTRSSTPTSTRSACRAAACGGSPEPRGSSLPTSRPSGRRTAGSCCSCASGTTAAGRRSTPSARTAAPSIGSPRSRCGRRLARLVAGRQADPLPQPRERRLPALQPLHDPAGRQRPQTGDARPRRDARVLGVVLARRQADHARPRGHRRRGGHLDHAHRRQRPHPGRPHAGAR